MGDPFAKNDIKIAVIGGGTGSFTLLSALKEHTSQLAALVNMADNGGSTGVLRDELGTLPPGDIRQCLVALSNSPKVRDLFNYRFEDGSLKGHAFGNLFLSALEKMTGSFSEGVELASEILNITGIVEPVTETDVTLVMERTDGTTIHGEFEIAYQDLQGERPLLYLEPEPLASPRAVRAIEEADMVVIAPGNLYGSLAPALIVPGIGNALQNTEATVVYVANLVNKPGQTDNFTVSDYAAEIERFAGGAILDAVLFNTATPSEELMNRYAGMGELPVTYDEKVLHDAPYIAAGAPLIAGAVWENTNAAADKLSEHRSLIRHDSAEIAKALIDLYRYVQDR